MAISRHADLGGVMPQFFRLGPLYVCAVAIALNFAKADEPPVTLKVAQPKQFVFDLFWFFV
jgi:hypothetical protein